MYERKYLIPNRTEYAVATISRYGLAWSASWKRIYRQAFWLSDGQRDIQHIALLLHKSEPFIERIIKELTVCGYTHLQTEKKTLTMNVPLLKQSFNMVASRKDQFAQSFYQRLFSYYPETRQLFAHTDMKRQGGSLMATLAAVIAGAERGENFISTLHKLGTKHYRYGAKPEHYPLVGGVLLETFHEYLGPNFTIEMQDAWSQAYELISEQMIISRDSYSERLIERKEENGQQEVSPYDSTGKFVPGFSSNGLASGADASYQKSAMNLADAPLNL